YQRDLEAGRREAREALALATEAGYQEGVAWALNLLGNVALRGGGVEQAGALLRRSLELPRDLGDRWRMASVLESLAAVARALGDPRRATKLDGGAGALRRALGTPLQLVEARDLEPGRAEAA